MDTTPSTFSQEGLSAEPARRFLDPSAEWRDCANQWDVSEVWRTPPAAPNSDLNVRKEWTPSGTEP